MRAQGTQDVLSSGAGANGLSGVLLQGVFGFTAGEDSLSTILAFEAWDVLSMAGFDIYERQDFRVSLINAGNL